MTAFTIFKQLLAVNNEDFQLKPDQFKIMIKTKC